MADDAEDIISLGGTPEPETEPEPEGHEASPKAAVEQFRPESKDTIPTAIGSAVQDQSAPKKPKQPGIDHQGLVDMLETRTAGATLLAEKVCRASFARKDVLLIDSLLVQFQDVGKPFVEICPHTLRTRCDQAQNEQCQLAHFHIRQLPQTDATLGDCSYLNTCHRLDTCRYVHYELETPSQAEAERMAHERQRMKAQRQKPESEQAVLPPQWLDADLRKLDTSVLGKFDVIMADPPWDSG